MIRLIGFLGLWFIFLPLNGQKSLRIDTTQDLDRLIERLFDNQTIIVRNVKYLGSKSAIGFFEMDTNAIGVRQGIVLSTGRVQDIPKGNQTPGTSGIAWNNEIRFRSDRDLNKLANGKVSDQVVLEFDFISFENHLTFNYVFASEEYPEYVGSRFNDVFGFILTSDGNFYQNLALVPNKNIPVTINNINHLKNSSYYISNNCFQNELLKKKLSETEINLQPRAPFFKKIIERVFGIKSKDFKIDLEVKKTLSSFLLENIEFDGMTRRLSASAFVEPYKVYHMKIAIGDVGDAMYDSGVFIESESFKSYHDVYQPYYKPYQDLRKSLNFDSIFQNKVTNPIVIDSPPQIEERFEITNINFDTDKSRIHDTAEVMIRELAQYLKKNLSYRIHLLGYTDNIGSQEYNQKLSERRAKAVKELLVKNGVTEDRINFIGNNFENPLMDNSIEFGRLINRRVEIVVLE